MGIYGYRAEFLKLYSTLTPSPLERAEALRVVVGGAEVGLGLVLGGHRFPQPDPPVADLGHEFPGGQERPRGPGGDLRDDAPGGLEQLLGGHGAGEEPGRHGLGPAELGRRLDVEVEISGQAPKEATLFYTTSDGAFVNELQASGGFARPLHIAPNRARAGVAPNRPLRAPKKTSTYR